MQHRRLGTTDLLLSVVGFGGNSVSGPWTFGYGSQDDRDSIAAIHHAVELGINWIDTAPVYGQGRSEQVIGEAMRQLPATERPYVFTKCSSTDGAVSSIRPQLEGSLQRLGLERIDLYQVHVPSYRPLEDAWDVLLDLKREGLVRYVGVSNFTVEQLESCEQRGHIDSLQPPVSAIRRTMCETVIPWCRTHGTGVLAHSAIEKGLLSGSFSPKRIASLPADDARRTQPEFTEPALSHHLRVADALSDVAQRHGVSAAAVAVAWVLAWPGVTAAIVGARHPEQVDGWVAAETLALTQDDLNEVAKAIERAGTTLVPPENAPDWVKNIRAFGKGPSHPGHDVAEPA